MRNTAEGLEFAGYLWRSRMLVAIACVSALVVAGIVSLLLPVRYTATASSTVYIESLKTFERLASSDTLFEHALDDLHIRQRYPGVSTETLKRRILEVSKPASMAI